MSEPYISVSITPDNSKKLFVMSMLRKNSSVGLLEAKEHAEGKPFPLQTNWEFEYLTTLLKTQEVEFSVIFSERAQADRKKEKEIEERRTRHQKMLQEALEWKKTLAPLEQEYVEALSYRRPVG